jgi:signal transduction histidine kinase
MARPAPPRAFVGVAAPLALAPALAGCSSGSATAAAGIAFAALSLVLVAVGFERWGRQRGRADALRAERHALGEARGWRALQADVAWRSDAAHRLTSWTGAAAADKPAPLAAAPDAERLAAVLRGERAFRALRLPAGGGSAECWALDGEPVVDGDGRFAGYVGSARLYGAGRDRAAAAAALAPTLAALPGAAVLAVRRQGPWQVQEFNAAAAGQWPGLGLGHELEPLVGALLPAVGRALAELAAGAAAEAEGWRLVRFGPFDGDAEGLLVARVGAPAAEAEAFGPTLSHDLRAPIRVVEGFTRIVKEDYGRVLDRVANDHLDRVLGAAARMNLMIDALLTLSRLSQLPLARQPVNLSQLASYVVDDLKRAAPERQVDIEIEPGLEVRGDPTLLRMVLENLLGNAWKYSARVPRARISLRRGEHEGRPCYEVSDNGAGFDMRSADRLFGLFQRLHSANDFAGHGVGLASVRRIVVRHGGQIWARAEPGRGATFSFTLG